MSKAKEMAFQEARHHKRIYDKKAGAIELQPGGPCPSENGCLRRPKEKIEKSVEQQFMEGGMTSSG